MIEVRKTETFAAWFDALRDRQARLRVQVRIDRLAIGNPGQHRALTGGVHEIKIDHGPSYRADLIGMPRATRRCAGGVAVRRRQTQPTQGHRNRPRDGPGIGDLK